MSIYIFCSLIRPGFVEGFLFYEFHDCIFLYVYYVMYNYLPKLDWKLEYTSLAYDENYHYALTYST